MEFFIYSYGHLFVQHSVPDPMTLPIMFLEHIQLFSDLNHCKVCRNDKKPNKQKNENFVVG
ncbi:unnamed protein product, partial [Musa banksii]